VFGADVRFSFDQPIIPTMRFINRTNNSVHLPEIDKTIPFLGDEDQFIDTDDILKSASFQTIVVAGKFVITEISDHRIERNLWDMQNPPESEPQIEPLKVIMRGHFFSNTGYAKANRNFALSLARQGVDIGVLPVSDRIVGLNELEATQISTLRAKPDPGAIFIDSTIPTFVENGTKYKHSILYTTVEGESVPQQFIDACERYDEVWVTSTFCKDVLVKCGVKKTISVVPNSVDSSVYNDSVPPHSFVPRLKSFVFLSVFGWNYRKGYDVLLKAYMDEFSKDDPVTLLIVTPYNLNESGHRTNKIEEEIKEYMATYGGWHRAAHVARCGRQIPEFEMPRLYRACNAFVLPTRGEGFGLPFVEASLCGLPVIATRGSGQGMFLNDENSYLLDVDKVSPMEAGKSRIHYWDGQMFPELKSRETINNLRTLMRHVYDNEEEAHLRNSKLQREILSKYTCESVSTLAKMKLEDIWNNR
jgi:glycosyltransferase involved in cell wall biosynthesis